MTLGLALGVGIAAQGFDLTFAFYFVAWLKPLTLEWYIQQCADLSIIVISFRLLCTFIAIARHLNRAKIIVPEWGICACAA